MPAIPTDDGLPGHERLPANLWSKTAVFPNSPIPLGRTCLTLAISIEILLEYEEVTVHLSGADRWRTIATLLEVLAQLHGNIRYVDPQFRFGAISSGPDDNKFCDCAIASQADFVVSEDNHFECLKTAGYKPQPIRPIEFIGVLASMAS